MQSPAWPTTSTTSTVQTMDPMQDDPQREGEDEVVGDDEVVDLDWDTVELGVDAEWGVPEHREEKLVKMTLKREKREKGWLLKEALGPSWGTMRRMSHHRNSFSFGVMLWEISHLLSSSLHKGSQSLWWQDPPCRGGSRVRMAGQLDLRRARGRHRHMDHGTHVELYYVDHWVETESTPTENSGFGFRQDGPS